MDASHFFYRFGIWNSSIGFFCILKAKWYRLNKVKDVLSDESLFSSPHFITKKRKGNREKSDNFPISFCMTLLLCSCIRKWACEEKAKKETFKCYLTSTWNKCFAFLPKGNLTNFPTRVGYECNGPKPTFRTFVKSRVAVDKLVTFCIFNSFQFPISRYYSLLFMSSFVAISFLMLSNFNYICYSLREQYSIMITIS